MTEEREKTVLTQGETPQSVIKSSKLKRKSILTVIQSTGLFNLLLWLLVISNIAFTLSMYYANSHQLHILETKVIELSKLKSNIQSTQKEHIKLISVEQCMCPPGPRGLKGEAGQKGDTASKNYGPWGYEQNIRTRRSTNEFGSSSITDIKYLMIKGTQYEVITVKGDKGDPGYVQTYNGRIIPTKGEPGERGPPGPEGPPGKSYIPRTSRYLNDGIQNTPVISQGPPGPPGPPGIKGDEGRRGKRGKPGEKGSQGFYGSRGMPGLPGMKGDQGDKGDKGVRGPMGLSGINGIKGDRGFPGEPGIQGPKGENGFVGMPGQPGPPGEVLHVNGTVIIGPKGNPGVRGPPGVSIKGDRGVPGNPGEPGQPGKPGFVGMPGSAGPEGPRGPPGKDGSPGAPGSPGPKGDRGGGGGGARRRKRRRHRKVDYSQYNRQYDVNMCRDVNGNILNDCIMRQQPAWSTNKKKF